jgi:hypothetical protein
MEKIKIFAPVIIPTLCRYEHFKRCVESLSRCTHAENTELIIGLDYPPKEEYVEGWKDIDHYIQHITGFKKVTLLKREKNYGAKNNIRDLKSYAFSKYDRLIFTEDDNEFSPNFLDYINKGLEFYKDDLRVYSICGYNYPIDMSPYCYNYYYSKEYSAWGCGLWATKCKRVESIIQKEDYLKDFIINQPLSTFTKNNFRLLPFVRHINKGYLGDVYITTYLQSSTNYCVFPKISMVRNWGHDGSGVNCRDNNKKVSLRYEQQEIQRERYFDYDEGVMFEIPEVILKTLQSFNNTTIKSRIKSMLILCMIKLKI